MGISFLSFNCFSSSNNSDKQQAAQSKVENTRTNLGTFSAIPFQNEVTAYTQPKTINKAQIAIAAATERMFEEVSVAETKAKITIAPYKTIDTHQDEYSDEDFNAETVSIINEQISPTCFRGLTDKDSTNLENIYVTTSENQFIAGRTGIIDTPKKAQHFDAIVRDQLINFPKENTIARVVSHQLNSPEAEGKMIEHQHLEMAILNQGQERYKVAHLNTPSNVLYDYTLYIRKIPLIGGFLGALIEGIFLYGERVSKDQNLEGLARMALWLKEDSDKVFYFEKGLSIIGMESLTDQMNALVDDIDEAVSANATGDLKEHRVSMKIHLMDYYNKLETLHQNLQPYVEDGENRNSFKQIQEKIALMKMILGDQLDIEG